MKIIHVDLADDGTRRAVAEVTLMAYTGEPCRVCGKTITAETVRTVVYAGYGKTGGRCAHQACRDAGKPKSEWVHGEDVD